MIHAIFSRSFWSKNNRWQISCDCIIIALLAYYVRFMTIGWHGLTDVEAQAIGIAHLSSWREIIHISLIDGNPPLFLFIVRLWTSIFGWSEYALKILALSISGVLPPLFYLVVSKHLGRKIAFQTGVLASLCPTLVCVSNLLRPHSLVAILTLLSTDQLFHLYSKPNSWCQRFHYGFLIALLLYCHQLTINIFLAHATFVALSLAKKWAVREQLVGWLIGSVIAVVLFLPMCASVPHVLRQSSTLWQNYFGFDYYSSMTLYALVKRLSIGIPTQITPALTCLGAIFLPIVLLQPSQKLLRSASSYAWLRTFYWVGLFSFFAGYFIFITMVHVWRDRYIANLAVFSLLLFTTAMHRITYHWRPKVISALLPILICLPIWVPQLDRVHILSDQCVYQAVQHIIVKCNPAKDLIVCAMMPYTPEFTRELPSNYTLIAFPDIHTNKLSYVTFDGLSEKIRDEKNYSEIERIMADTLKNSGRIWFIEPPPIELIDKLISLKIDNSEDFNMAELKAARRLREWLFLNAQPDEQRQLYISHYSAMSETCFIAKKPYTDVNNKVQD